MIEGLVGELQAHFCEGEAPVDEGLALGAALNVFAMAAWHGYAVLPPAPHEMFDERVEPRDVHHIVCLVDTFNFGGRELIKRTDSLLRSLRGKSLVRNFVLHTIEQRLYSSQSEETTMLVWEEKRRGAVLDDRPSLNSHVLLVPPCGVFRADPPQERSIVSKLLAIAGRSEKYRVRMDPLATEAFRGLVNQWLKEACESDTLVDHGPRVHRWTNVAALLAVGMNPDDPVISYDLLVTAERVGVRDHEMTRDLLKSMAPMGEPTTGGFVQ